MPIYFERRQVGRGSILNIYGEKAELSAFADEIKEQLKHIDQVDADGKVLPIESPELTSTIYSKVNLICASESGVSKILKRSRKQALVIMIVFAALIFLWILLYQLGFRKI